MIIPDVPNEVRNALAEQEVNSAEKRLVQVCCFTLLQRTLQMRVFFHGVTGNVSEGVVNKKGQNVKQPHFQTMEDFVQESFL
jgi:hypothetical protein